MVSSPSNQSAAARARAYSEAVRASKNANGNIATLQQPSSLRPTSTPTSPATRAPPTRTTITAKRAAKPPTSAARVSSSKRVPASPPTAPRSQPRHPSRVARSSSSASSSASLGTRIRREAAQVAAELLSNQPKDQQGPTVPPPVEDVLASDGQGWMQFLQRTAAQLEQEVAKLPVDNVVGSTRGTSSRSRHTTGSTAGSGVSRPESPLPTSTAAVLLSSSVGVPLLSDDTDAQAAGSFLAGGGEGDTGGPGPSEGSGAAGTLSQLLRVLTDEAEDASKAAVANEQSTAVEAFKEGGPVGVAGPLTALLEPQDLSPVATQPAPAKADRYRPDDQALPTSPRQAQLATKEALKDSAASGSKGNSAEGTAPKDAPESKDAPTKPLKNTAAGSRLIKNAPSRSTATVRQLADALNIGLKVHKRWQREGRRRGQGSQRMVQAGVVDGRVVVDYLSGCWGRRRSSVVNSVELSLGEWKTVLLLHTDHGVLRLAPFSADACAEWVLGINTLLHLTAKELSASQAAIHLPWHKDVQVAADTPV